MCNNVVTQANWVARRAESKPMTIDEIHEEDRINRAQKEREADRERQQRRDQNRNIVIGSAYSGGNQQSYNDSRGSRGSAMKQQNSRNDEDRVENRFNVNSVRQLQSNDKRNQGPIVGFDGRWPSSSIVSLVFQSMNLAPQRTWAKGSGIDRKPDEDQSLAARYDVSFLLNLLPTPSILVVPSHLPVQCSNSK
jgi:hypothetical protein